MKTKTIRQTANFNASTHDVYEALMNSKKHAKFTQSKASISRNIGGLVSAYDGWISGVNEKLVPGKLIVQKWRGTDWPEGHYSKVAFKLDKTKNGTKLTFIQTGVPVEHYQEINQGWHEHYWDKMKRVFGW